jgi:hypothetical protein
MGIDISKIRNKLNKLQNTQKKSDLLWKPTPGKHQVRIVPYKFRPDNPFIELYFHYNINNKTYLSPISFGDADPINEFAEKLKNIGTKEDWKTGKNMEPKLRTFVPVIIRGKENEGVKFWGFGKTVYQELLAYIADADYGDITDPANGRDITIEYTSAQDGGTNFPTTTIRVKPKETPMVDDIELAKKLVKEQSEITDIYSVLSYDELAEILEKWLNGSDEEETEGQEQSVSQQTLSSSPAKEETVAEDTTEEEPKSTPNPTAKNDVADAFSALFDKK